MWFSASTVNRESNNTYDLNWTRQKKIVDKKRSIRKTRSAMAPNKSAKNGTTSHHNNNNNNNNSGSSTSSKKKQPQKLIKIKKPKTRDSDCCSINFIKYVLIIIDIIFFVSKTFLPFPYFHPRHNVFVLQFEIFLFPTMNLNLICLSVLRVIWELWTIQPVNRYP